MSVLRSKTTRRCRSCSYPLIRDGRVRKNRAGLVAPTVMYAPCRNCGAGQFGYLEGGK